MLLAAIVALNISAPHHLQPLWQRWAADAKPAAPEAGVAGTDHPRNGEAAVPVAVNAVAIVYNVLVAGDLRIDARLLDGMLSGRIARWRDPAIAALNPGVTFPDAPIRLVLQDDAAADSAPVREYLAKSLGAQPAPWTVKRVASPTEVQKLIAATDGALGFVDSALARRMGLFVAAMKNRAGAFVLPSSRSVSLASVGVRLGEDLRGSIVDARGSEAYPIAALTYATYDPASQQARAFLRWVLHDGQRLVTPYGYAPLPGLLVLSAEARLTQ